MRVKNRRVLRAHAGADLLLHGEQLLLGLAQGAFEPLSFSWNLLRRNGLARDGIHPVVREDQHLAPANARRHGDAVQNPLALVDGLWHAQ